jgi:hypothetical protein
MLFVIVRGAGTEPTPAKGCHATWLAEFGILPLE